ncbi:hypothetical protein GS399_02640 [Pedobacter sp. HMF7647]|uniref:Carboxypeptidase-like regulatory domain-containing protein n=1 Tax=Hufsiella arboris TaxID=2695275 RepID=A0A7K1Y5I3_9SPHI|nr:hypothetical protein [Hufsiella arboris]MXV49853.1 hypothetical protein [Hufsiella arboris]
MKKTILTVLPILFILLRAYSQSHEVAGLIYDRDSKQRLTRVKITNLKTNQSFYNNVKGEFTTNASTGDSLSFSLPGYITEKVAVQSQRSLFVYLRRNSIQLREVVVTENAITPVIKHDQNKRDYKDIYRRGSSKDILTVGGANGLGGAGLGIDALYNLISKQGKDARYLQGIIERDYRNSMIDYRYNKTLVNLTTGLSGEKLNDFMQQYRPSYQFILQATDYQLIDYIKNNYQRYLLNPSAFKLQPLVVDPR